jgi:hypothetical protein
MITETELREAMQHSAARADQRIEQQSLAADRPNLIDLQGPIDRSPTARRRTWVPLAAAAAVAVVAGGGLMLAARPAHHSPAAPKKDTAAAVAPAQPHNKPAAVKPHAAVTLTNLVTISGTDAYTLDAGTETLNAPGGIGGTQLMALPAGGFDPAKRLTGAHPVSVAGTQGYAGKALLWLIDPNDTEQAKKAGAPRNTVAWPVGDGTWLVLQNFMAAEPGFTDLPEATLIHDAGQFEVKTAPAPLRSGYRARWLPAGLTLTSADASVGQPASSLTLTAGRKSIDIQLDTLGGTPIPVGHHDMAVASRQIKGYTVVVTATGYEKGTAQRVLDGLDVSKLHGPQSGWWTFDQAVNG